MTRPGPFEFRSCARKAAEALALAGFVCVGPAQAGGLFSIPTADTQEARSLSLQLEQDGDHLNSDGTLRLATVDAGITDFLTAGFDLRLSGTPSLRPNAALRLTPKDSPVSFGVGYANVGVRSFGEQFYGVASASLLGFREHAGITHDPSGEHAMLGLERPLGEEFSLQADWVSGPGSFLTVGGQASLPLDFSLALGFMRANSHDDDNGVYLSLEKDFKL